ncbi:hypothetical protein HYFRA_00008741 [Hymenoscyphus fraxineus]|uniref:WD40 repeat-like protein n=1 Tax=Hymenoscyphus fraxineus TaxID=746836 RepID=A0A9N9KZH8_9HELO|nr:hypothetical protein HYFRA_00008741 [Hymenoscyphus fraxineus]
MEPTGAFKTPKLVAFTGTTYSCSIAESRVRESKLLNNYSDVPETRQPCEEDGESNYFKNGTSLITSNADNTIRTFILPPTLLDESPSPIPLTPYTTHQNPSPINCVAPYPNYNLSDPSTTLYLSSPSALPIRLTNSVSPSPAPTATYTLISPTTEAYYTPSSLLWTSSGTFLAGTDCLIALFDVSRNGQGPIQSMPTIPSKRHVMKGGGVGMRGIVSALSLQPTSEGSEAGMVAAGTWTRCVGLYDMAGLGGTVATWSIAEAADKDAGIGGMGVTQTAWSVCGRYLYVVERKSRGVLVYDVRGAGKLLAWLEGREAETNQRLGVDVFNAEKGMEVWAGGLDGVVGVWEGVGREAETNQRLGVDVFNAEKGMEVWAGGLDGVVGVWEGVGMSEGALERSWEWKAHDDPITSTIVHSSGTVVATCSGQRSIPMFEGSESESGSEESSNDSGEDSDIIVSKYGVYDI